MGFFKSLKQKSAAETIKLCPKCEQPTITRTPVGQIMNTDYYICSNCDYQGSFFIEFEFPPKGQDPAADEEKEMNLNDYD